MLERRDDKVLGLFPRTRWPAADTAHEDAVRLRLRAALVEGADPDERTGALAALLHAVDRAHKTVDRGPVSAREVRKRAKALAEGQWAAEAVRDAIMAATAVTVGGHGRRHLRRDHRQQLTLPVDIGARDAIGRARRSR